MLAYQMYVQPSIINTCMQEQPDLGTDTKQPTRALIVFNLFALEGFHLAEALGVPCLAVSPCLVPYSPPAAFARRFKKSSAALYQALQEAAPGTDLIVPSFTKLVTCLDYASNAYSHDLYTVERFCRALHTFACELSPKLAQSTCLTGAPLWSLLL